MAKKDKSIKEGKDHDVSKATHSSCLASIQNFVQGISFFIF